MTKWMQDVADAQNADGSCRPLCPMRAMYRKMAVRRGRTRRSFVPWTMYLCYGDTRILEDNYATMSKFMDFLVEGQPRLYPLRAGIRRLARFWRLALDQCQYPARPDRHGFSGLRCHLMAQIAAVLGKTDDAAHYQQLFEESKQAFADRYLIGSTIPAFPVAHLRNSPADGRRRRAFARQSTSRRLWPNHVPSLQHRLVYANANGVCPGAAFRPAAGRSASASGPNWSPTLSGARCILSTGFVGAPYLPHVLSGNGQLDTAYALLYQKSWPSWLYSVTQGATTIWERWDGWTEENGFQDPYELVQSLRLWRDWRLALQHRRGY